MPFRLIFFLTLLLTAAFSSTARADQPGLYVSYVAANGSDNNAGCYNTAPCATLAMALSKTTSGGTVVCLSSPLYQPITITSSVTVDCPYFSPSTIIINLPANDTLSAVHLRGFVLSAGGGTNVGIQITSGRTVLLENITLKGLNKQGVLDQRSVPGKLIIKNSIISQNLGPGVVVAGASGNTAILDNVTLSDNTYGIATAAGNSVSIIRSDISNNSLAGVEADGGSLVIVDGCLISHNNVGIASGSAIRLSNNNITFNTTGVNGATGTYGNNRFAGNGSDGTALTPVPGGSTDLGQK